MAQEVRLKAGELATEVTERDLLIINMVANGRSDQYIADTVRLSRNTIRTILSTMYATYRVRNREHLTAYACREGWVDYNSVEFVDRYR
jgi:DNA-binding NarL/FixJ family response regulator